MGVAVIGRAMWGRSASSVGVGFKSRSAAKPRRGTAHVDSDSL